MAAAAVFPAIFRSVVDHHNPRGRTRRQQQYKQQHPNPTRPSTSPSSDSYFGTGLSASAAAHSSSSSSSSSSVAGGGEGGELKKNKNKRFASLPNAIPPLPTFQQYQRFALPCLALWVAGPLLSLVDTAFIGVSATSGEASARNLAALGPATTFFDGATYLFAFLNVATTNLYSRARAQAQVAQAQSFSFSFSKKEHDDALMIRDDTTESVVRTAAQVAMNCGVGLMLFLLAFCRPLLKLYIGPEASRTPGLLDNASDYVMIRALSMPTSLLLGVLQAALLGAQDSVTPLIAIVYATLVNVSCDYLFCRHFQWGLQGAALATTLAQWVSTYALLRPARQKLVRNHDLRLWRKKNSKKSKGTSSNTHTKTNTNVVTAQSFLSLAAPVLTLIVGKLAAFGFMTHAAAAAPGQPTPLAAHQIVLALLFACSPFLEVISQTAQTFLPPFVAPVQEYYYFTKQKKTEKKNYDGDVASTGIHNNENNNIQVVQEWQNRAHTVATQLLKMGVWTALIVASVASLVPRYFGHVLTKDTTVQTAVQPLAKYLWLGALFWAPVAVSEGVLLARRELRFLASVYLVSTALLPLALLRVKARHGGVGAVWACFSVFQISRAVLFTSRIWGGRFLETLKQKRQRQVRSTAM